MPRAMNADGRVSDDLSISLMCILNFPLQKDGISDTNPRIEEG